jgi:Domain of unknown function (DUF4760)
VAPYKLGEIANVNVKVPVRIFGVLVVLVVGFTAGYCFLPGERTDLEFLALAVTAAATIGGSFWVGESLRRGLEQQKKREAFALMARWNSPQLFHARSATHKVLETFKRPGGGDGAVRALLNSDENVAMNARHVLNFLEELAIAVKVDHADEELLATAFAGLVLRSFRAYQSWIAEHRSAADRQKVWAELEGLYKKWENR